MPRKSFSRHLENTQTQELQGALPPGPPPGRCTRAPGPHPLRLRGMPLAHCQRTLQISPPPHFQKRSAGAELRYLMLKSCPLQNTRQVKGARSDCFRFFFLTCEMVSDESALFFSVPLLKLCPKLSSRRMVLRNNLTFGLHAFHYEDNSSYSVKFRHNINTLTQL